MKAAVEDQIVTLDGSVNLYIDRENLEKKVKKMKNVDGVRNHVQIQSNVPDDQLRQTLADRLRYDRVGYGIAFNAITLDVKDGVATIQRYEMDPQKPIRIVVENGHVTLYGVVDNAMDKQIAGTQANSVPGVFSVDNQLIALSDTKK